MRRAIINVVLVLLATLALSGCSTVVLAGTGGLGCTNNSEYFHRSSHVAGTMGGQGAVKCEVQVSKIVVHTWIEKWDGEEWIQYGNKASTPHDNVKGYTTVKGGKYVACARGTYRVVSYGAITYRGKPYYTLTLASPPRTDVC